MKPQQAPPAAAAPSGGPRAAPRAAAPAPPAAAPASGWTRLVSPGPATGGTECGWGGLAKSYLAQPLKPSGSYSSALGALDPAPGEAPPPVRPRPRPRCRPLKPRPRLKPPHPSRPSRSIPAPFLAPPPCWGPPLAEAPPLTSLTALRSGALAALSRRSTFLAPSATACSTRKWCLSSSMRSSTAPRSGLPVGAGCQVVRPA